LFDPNYDCNVHCVYCHNTRSQDVIKTEDFQAFINDNVVGAKQFQIGCAMEPTLDQRLADLMLMVAESRAKPTQMFRLQTNGILLHRHDHGKMRDAGLTMLSLSVDTFDPTVFKKLRGGTSLSKVKSNLIHFREHCPNVTLVFVTTVTSLNIRSIDTLIRTGLELGVKRFNLRQMFYYPNSNIVDHSQMPTLIVTDEDFAEMSDRVRVIYGNIAHFHIQPARSMIEGARSVRNDSLLSPPQPWDAAAPMHGISSVGDESNAAIGLWRGYPV
jgi:MoaA/NifB/PqqE/SkfB family radical SAM enzyme